MSQKNTIRVDGKDLAVGAEQNLLQLIRRAGIEIPTFCYHSELSVYGACRLCLVDIDGRGIVTSCSTPPTPGMVVRTNTEEVRRIRRINLELMLANHRSECTTCSKSAACQLQELSRKLGVRQVRFRRTRGDVPLDLSSPSVARDPNKCILCGDCVRTCREVQGIGAIDFAYRGQRTVVTPAFGKGLADVDCVHCGQCARVCPTGAITPRSQLDEVWQKLDDPRKKVIAQVAPAVRVALGEMLGVPSGEVATGRIVAALKAIGFDRVYDTCFAADLTVMEEGAELLTRRAAGTPGPLFSSCCPAWVAYAEQYLPGLLPNLSTCKSPQQMFGAVAKAYVAPELGVAPEDLTVVSIMPCTAKKSEALLERFKPDGVPEVDHVLTTVELARMIEERGLHFASLTPESLDLPLGLKSGASVLFGASGGVTEAVLRFAASRSGNPRRGVEYTEVRGEGPIRTATVAVGELTLDVAVVHGLANARIVADAIARGEAHYDFVEVMACPGGCIGGAGQPVSRDARFRQRRAQALYEVDRSLPLYSSNENEGVWRLYEARLGEPGSATAHRLLHTHYHSRRRLAHAPLPLVRAANADGVTASVCVGTSCYLRGAQELLRGLSQWVRDNELGGRVTVEAHFCFESCDRGPTVRIGAEKLRQCSLEAAKGAILSQLGAAAQTGVAPSTLDTPATLAGAGPVQ